MLVRFSIAVCIFTCILAGTSTAQSQVDALYLHDGSKILGTIIEMVPNKHIKIRMYDGSEMVYDIDKVARVTKEVEEREVQASPPPRIDHDRSHFLYDDADLTHTAYTELGLNVGTPSGLNIAIGRWFGPVGARLSGAYLGDDLFGFQANLGVKLSDNYSRSHVIAAVVGLSVVTDDNSIFIIGGDVDSYSRHLDWSYLGVVYELNLHGFFLQAGLSVGEGDYTNPQLLIQLGYMYRFLPD